jgi:hypothetical protein
VLRIFVYMEWTVQNDNTILDFYTTKYILIFYFAENDIRFHLYRESTLPGCISMTTIPLVIIQILCDFTKYSMILQILKLWFYFLGPSDCICFICFLFLFFVVFDWFNKNMTILLCFSFVEVSPSTGVFCLYIVDCKLIIEDTIIPKDKTTL